MRTSRRHFLQHSIAKAYFQANAERVFNLGYTKENT